MGIHDIESAWEFLRADRQYQVSSVRLPVAGRFAVRAGSDGDAAALVGRDRVLGKRPALYRDMGAVV